LKNRNKKAEPLNALGIELTDGALDDAEEGRVHHGGSCALKSVKHGNDMDYVQDGRSHRVNNMKLIDESAREE
jgi:hypothetical protein